ncbi:MAG: TetR/AcrR family transcriptional regulator [Bdellovibrio sp.]
MKAKTKTKIIESAMECIADLGLEATTFQAIADKAKISQPLVAYHLKKRENIFIEAFTHLLDTSLVATESSLAEALSPKDKLINYIMVSLQVFRSHAAIPKMYIAFYYLSSFDPTYRKMNDKLKQEATQRILNILALGLGSGDFKSSDPLLTAKIIHTSITGLLLNLACENSAFSDEILLQKLTNTILTSVLRT